MYNYIATCQFPDKDEFMLGNLAAESDEHAIRECEKACDEIFPSRPSILYVQRGYFKLCLDEE